VVSGTKRRRSGKQRPRGTKREDRAPAPRAAAGSRFPLRGWLALALAVVAFSASGWFFVVFPSERGPGQGSALELDVPSQPTADQLAAILSSAGVLSNPRLFALWLRATGGAARVVPGMHLLTDDASPREIMARLERRPGGGSARVTFPEGWTRFDMARRLQDKHVVSLRAFLDATVDPRLLTELRIEGDSAEGFLFPTTYDLPLDSEAADIVRRMKREFERRWDILASSRASSLTDVMSSAHLDVRQLVTLASMVEKEAVADDERPLIASVFLNRLRDPAFKPKRLECDPTASYGCLAMPEKAASCAGFTGKATAAIEHDPDNPYSTYTHEGLPPGPITNPGAKSLDAAMSPASSHFFYFVARGDGRSTFSETYEAHASAVKESPLSGTSVAPRPHRSAPSPKISSESP
jgi:UPF0755 protein